MCKINCLIDFFFVCWKIIKSRSEHVGRGCNLSIKKRFWSRLNFKFHMLNRFWIVQNLELKQWHCHDIIIIDISVFTLIKQFTLNDKFNVLVELEKSSSSDQFISTLNFSDLLTTIDSNNFINSINIGIFVKLPNVITVSSGFFFRWWKWCKLIQKYHRILVTFREQHSFI